MGHITNITKRKQQRNVISSGGRRIFHWKKFVARMAAHGCAWLRMEGTFLLGKATKQPS
jgi:hypothetical protein